MAEDKSLEDCELRFERLYREAKKAVKQELIHFIVLVYSGHGVFGTDDLQTFGFTERDSNDKLVEGIRHYIPIEEWVL